MSLEVGSKRGWYRERDKGGRTKDLGGGFTEGREFKSRV